MSPLSFRVLGPLSVQRNGVELVLGPTQQRVMLAVLLGNANRNVSRDQLIDSIWGDGPPEWAVNLVQRHASRLRRVLEPDRTERSASCLTWTDAGYRLKIPPESLDLAQFDRLIGEAQTTRAAGEPGRAVRLLGEALELWRGPFCAGLTSPYVDALRDRLAERQITAQEDRIEWDMIAGATPQLIEELRQLIAANPFRDRLHILLMTALYRSGRAADALTTYQDARRLLRKELGIEPSAALQRIQQQILTHDPRLLAGLQPPEQSLTESSQPTLTAAKPAQLPHLLGDFVGRRDELQILDEEAARATASTRIIVIAGGAGLGKTALALFGAHRVKDQFPDGQLYVNLRGFDPHGPPIEPAVAIRGFLDALGVPPERIPVDLDQQAGLYRSLLADRRVLVVLDNARDAAQVRSLLPGSPNCYVLITSREQLAGLLVTDGARALTLDVLSDAGSRELLARRIGQERVRSDPDAVEAILVACGRLPLALSMVAARASYSPQFTMTVLAEELEGARDSLDVFDGGEQAIDIRAVFSWSYEKLTPPVARLFRHLALTLGEEVSVAAAASLVGLTISDVRPLLAALTRINLVIEREPGRFTMHDLLRTYAGEVGSLWDSADDRRAAVHRLLDHYLHTAYDADRLVNPYRDDPISLGSMDPSVTAEVFQDHRRALNWFVQERPTLITAAQRADSEGLGSHAWRLAWSLSHFLEASGHWHDSATVHTLAIRAAEMSGDNHARAVSHAGLADALIRLERYEEAEVHLARALQLYEELGDTLGMAHVHRTLTWVFDRPGHYLEAMEHAVDALRLFEQAEHRSGEARALNAIAWFHHKLGDQPRAVQFGQRALELQREIEARFDQADTLDSLGRANEAMGRHEEAISCYLQAVDLYREFGHRYNEADELVLLGEAYRAHRDLTAARAVWQTAEAILDELRHPDLADVRVRIAALPTPTPNA